jgi:nucleotide-binding universal stress UspA family protein
MPTAEASLRLTFKNILLPTDFTSASEVASAFARSLATNYDSSIFVTHAITPTPPIFLPLEPVPLDLDAEWHDAQHQLQNFLNLAALKGTRHEGILERGEIWTVLNDVVGRHAIDLIVLGSHGKHGLKKLVLGSAAEQIFRHADCPVLTVGPKVVAPGPGEVAFKHILFATDFSAGSLRALPYAVSLAEENQARLALLHVTPLVPEQHRARVIASAAQRLHELIPAEAENWCQAAPVESFEFPTEGILHVAETEKADLIVMGVHRRAPRTSSHLPWAIAYEVVSHAHCPVLTVRG